MNSKTIATFQPRNARMYVPEQGDRTGELTQKTLYTTSRRSTSLPNQTTSVV
jgi:hypothetical protein